MQSPPVTFYGGVALFITASLQTGCVNIATDLQSINPDVQAVLVGRGCTPILLGFGFGHNTVAQAQRDNVHVSQRFEGFQNVTTPITKFV